jgi:hypothetical protein
MTAEFMEVPRRCRDRVRLGNAGESAMVSGETGG